MKISLIFLLISIFFTYSKLNCSSETCLFATISDELVIPAKGDFARLPTEDLQKMLRNHEDQLATIGITSTNAEGWYAIAKEYRHLFFNEEANSFAATLYNKLTTAPMIGDDLKSRSHRAFSKYFRRKGLTKEALSHALTAAMIGRDSNEFGQTLLYLGDCLMYDIKDLSRAKDYYVRSIQWCATRDMRKCYIKALIALGNIRYLDEWHMHRSDWYREALGLMVSSDDPRLLAKVLIGLADSCSNDNRRESINSYLRVLSVLDNAGDADLQAQACIGLGKARYIDQAHTNDSSWFLEALRILSTQGDANLQAQAFIGVGHAHCTDENHTIADWYREALKILGTHGDPALKATALIGLGTSHCSRGDNQVGLDYFRRAARTAPPSMQDLIGEKIARAEQFLRIKKAQNKSH